MDPRRPNIKGDARSLGIALSPLTSNSESSMSDMRRPEGEDVLDLGGSKYALQRDDRAQIIALCAQKIVPLTLNAISG